MIRPRAPHRVWPGTVNPEISGECTWLAKQRENREILERNAGIQVDLYSGIVVASIAGYLTDCLQNPLRKTIQHVFLGAQAAMNSLFSPIGCRRRAPKPSQDKIRGQAHWCSGIVVSGIAPLPGCPSSIVTAEIKRHVFAAGMNSPLALIGLWRRAPPRKRRLNSRRASNLRGSGG